MATQPRLRAHFVLSTHWDREWYESFQFYRYRLVQLLDKVLAGLEDGRLRGPFQTDGQSIILEDYLEIRPERRAQIERLAAAGKLVIGPWYVLPDEFLVSGESLIRNLQRGRAVARSFGAPPSNAGFVCDLFGHNSQMPQIFAGFGIHGGFVWRGLNHLQTRHLHWRGADGTEMLVYRFPGGGYCDYAFQVRHARSYASAADDTRVASDLRSYLEHEAEHTEVDALLLFDGGDHEEWDQDVYSAMLRFGEQEDGDFEIVHTSLDHYLADILPQAARVGATAEGELREAGRLFAGDQQWVIPGVLSSRVWIKQANAACESLLTQWAEPFSTFAHLALGSEMPAGYLDVAWQWLLKNHPHDSICGCSIDVVHEDMKYRFSQARQIANRVTLEATRQIAASVTGDLSDDELRVAVFNPLPHPLDETAELTLQIPTHWPQFNEFFGFEPKPAFRIYGPDGVELPYQRLRQTTDRRKVRLYPTKFPEAYTTHDVTVSLPLTVPALGYTTLTVRAPHDRSATRHPATPGLATSERSMANEALAVTIESNGSLTVHDKRSGETYTRWLTFEDCADIGDGWYHGEAVNDQTFVSTASRAAVALVHNGPQLTTFRIRTALQIPEAFDFDATMQRSARLTDLVVDSLVSLRPGLPRIEVETTVRNVAADHRLRVLFPSGVDAATYWADTPFDVVERPIALAPDNYLYRELEVETKPQQTWTAVQSGSRGLAVISAGLHESAVCDLPERTLALTLLRSTRRTVFTDGEPGGLLIGDLTFRYWLVPLAGAPDPAHLLRLGRQLAGGLRDVQLRAEDVTLHRTATPLPPSASLCTVEGAAILTSLRAVAGGVEVRAYNPTNEVVQVGFSWGDHAPFTQAIPVNFDGEVVAPSLPVTDGQCHVELARKKIITLRFEP
ncbi:MAG: glycoside hydrolase family 38 [Chloroflexi bacterium]|nr:MAG: glycoside hydrolase family 38 [Chloroflexota bacterium]